MIDRNTKCDQKGTKVEGRRHESGLVCSGEEGKPIAIGRRLPGRVYRARCNCYEK